MYITLLLYALLVVKIFIAIYIMFCVIINSYFANCKKKFNILNNYNETAKKNKGILLHKGKIVVIHWIIAKA